MFQLLGTDLPTCSCLQVKTGLKFIKKETKIVI